MSDLLRKTLTAAMPLVLGAVGGTAALLAPSQFASFCAAGVL